MGLECRQNAMLRGLAFTADLLDRKGQQKPWRLGPRCFPLHPSLSASASC